MKKLALIVAILATTTLAQAETMMGTFKGKLRGTDTRDVHTLDLKKGNYRYELKLSGAKKAKTNFKIKKKRLPGTAEVLVDRRKLPNRKTYTGDFRIKVKGIVGQNTGGTRETKFILSKKAGPRQVNYTLKVYKK
ncbi:MAG TPA: hypothetical protein ENK82_02090 [Campylobacterales bacterium]|nr:hypothetical protein [Campylobacterales bacterium]HHS92114.1 hypothetical protein [Campylobacterales bacterium]